MRARPVVLGVEQRLFVEATVPLICARGGWGYHVASAGPDHVHTLVSGAVEGTKLRTLLKRWLGQELSSRWLPGPALSDAPRGGRTWWAEGGSVKWVWKQDYFRRAFDYIAAQRTTEFGASPGSRP